MKVVYIAQNGDRTEVDGDAGASVMETAVSNGVDGIVGECGGSLSCSTCHVYVDAAWVDRLDEKDGLEDEMLDGTASPRLENSRLSCQIVLDDERDGIVVHLPESQT